MKYIRFTLFSFLFIISSVHLLAQDAVIKGKIIDPKTNEGLIGVNISTDKNIATVSDLNGLYELRLPEGNYSVTISYVGYKDFKKDLSVKSGDSVQLDFPMEEEARNVLGDELVITGSLFQKKASEEVISIEVIQPRLIANTNATRIDEVIRRVSGVNVVDGQA
ncbi:MAG: TonB-dependent receptor, partial [Bacteroidota bacterium]|nr:TonB-dependent receptor [Bacteroidota bacterium]